VIGISAEQGIAFSILLLLIIALDSMIGGLIFLLQQMPKRQMARAS
jgi:hypothetical protein